MDTISNIIYEVGENIVTDRNVISASQNLLVSTAKGGAQIATAAVGTLAGTGSLSATVSAVGTSISTAATGLGHAIMSNTCVSWGVAAISSPIFPFVVAGGLFLWLCCDD